MVEAAIFDLDHTLYDFMAPTTVAADAVNEYIKVNFQMGPKEADAKIKEAMRRTDEKVGSKIAAIHSRTLRYQTFCEMEGFSAAKHAHKMGELYWDIFFRHMQLDPDVIPMLERLRHKKIPVIICTDMTSTVQFKKIEILGLSNYVDYVVTSEEAGAEKPADRILDLCVQKAGVKKEHCVFLGDHPIKDVIGPMRYGMQAVWCRRYDPFRFLKSFDMEVDITEPIEHQVMAYADCMTDDGLDFDGIVI